MAYQIHDDSWIDGARTGPHHQAFERGESHGRIHAFAVANGAERRAISQVADDELARRWRAARAILMIDPVKTEAADAFFEPRVWAGIDVSGRLQGGMKSGIEDGDLRHAGPNDAVHRSDCFQFETIVRRRELHLLSDGRSNLGSKRRGSAICRSAMDDTMSDHIDFRILFEKRFEDRLQHRFRAAWMLG